MYKNMDMMNSPWVLSVIEYITDKTRYEFPYDPGTPYVLCGLHPSTSQELIEDFLDACPLSKVVRAANSLKGKGATHVLMDRNTIGDYEGTLGPGVTIEPFDYGCFNILKGHRWTYADVNNILRMVKDPKVDWDGHILSFSKQPLFVFTEEKASIIHNGVRLHLLRSIVRISPGTEDAGAEEIMGLSAFGNFLHGFLYYIVPRLVGMNNCRESTTLFSDVQSYARQMLTDDSEYLSSEERDPELNMLNGERLANTQFQYPSLVRKGKFKALKPVTEGQTREAKAAQAKATLEGSSMNAISMARVLASKGYSLIPKGNSFAFIPTKNWLAIESNDAWLGACGGEGNLKDPLWETSPDRDNLIIALSTKEAKLAKRRLSPHAQVAPCYGVRPRGLVLWNGVIGEGVPQETIVLLTGLGAPGEGWNILSPKGEYQGPISIPERRSPVILVRAKNLTIPSGWKALQVKENGWDVFIPTEDVYVEKGTVICFSNTNVPVLSEDEGFLKEVRTYHDGKALNVTYTLVYEEKGWKSRTDLFKAVMVDITRDILFPHNDISPNIKVGYTQDAIKWWDNVRNCYGIIADTNLMNPDPVMRLLVANCNKLAGISGDDSHLHFREEYVISMEYKALKEYFESKFLRRVMLKRKCCKDSWEFMKKMYEFFCTPAPSDDASEAAVKKVGTWSSPAENVYTNGDSVFTFSYNDVDGYHWLEECWAYVGTKETGDVWSFSKVERITLRESVSQTASMFSVVLNTGLTFPHLQEELLKSGDRERLRANALWNMYNKFFETYVEPTAEVLKEYLAAVPPETPEVELLQASAEYFGDKAIRLPLFDLHLKSVRGREMANLKAEATMPNLALQWLKAWREGNTNIMGITARSIRGMLASYVESESAQKSLFCGPTGVHAKGVGLWECPVGYMYIAHSNDPCSVYQVTRRVFKKNPDGVKVVMYRPPMTTPCVLQIKVVREWKTQQRLNPYQIGYNPLMVYYHFGDFDGDPNMFFEISDAPLASIEGMLENVKAAKGVDMFSTDWLFSPDTDVDYYTDHLVVPTLAKLRKKGGLGKKNLMHAERLGIFNRAAGLTQLLAVAGLYHLETWATYYYAFKGLANVALPLQNLYEVALGGFSEAIAYLYFGWLHVLMEGKVYEISPELSAAIDPTTKLLLNPEEKLVEAGFNPRFAPLWEKLAKAIPDAITSEEPEERWAELLFRLARGKVDPEEFNLIPEFHNILEEEDGGFAITYFKRVIKTNYNFLLRKGKAPMTLPEFTTNKKGPRFAKGDMWSAYGEADLFVVTTNSYVRKAGTLVMGRGAAYEMSQRIPNIDRIFGQMILDSCGHLGEYNFLRSGKHGALQVKYNFRDNADLELIKRSLAKLQAEASNLKVHLNFPGIGNGGLAREEVLPLLTDLPATWTIWEKGEEDEEPTPTPPAPTTSAILNDKQREAYDVAVNSNYHLAMVGYAGTGKTFTLCRIIAGLKEKGWTSIVCTPTNQAAQVFKAELNDPEVLVTTINSAFGLTLGTATHLPDGLVDACRQPRKNVSSITRFNLQVKRRFQGKKVAVVFDEAYMISAQLMYMATKILEELCSEHKIILAGDPAQLPPTEVNWVDGVECPSRIWQKPAFRLRQGTNLSEPVILEGLFDRYSFKHVVLETVVRQKDPAFQYALELARVGVVHPLLRERTITEPVDGLRCYYNNRRIAELQRAKVEEAKAQGKRCRTYTAEVIGGRLISEDDLAKGFFTDTYGNLVEILERDEMEIVGVIGNRKKTYPIYEPWVMAAMPVMPVMTLVEGERFKFCKNIYREEGGCKTLLFANGEEVKIVELREDYISVEKGNGQIYSVGFEEIDTEEADWREGKKSGRIYRQLPGYMAFAITPYKLQGTTLGEGESLVVHPYKEDRTNHLPPERRKAEPIEQPGAMYVAASRVKSLDQLYFCLDNCDVHLFLNSFKADEEALEFLREGRRPLYVYNEKVFVHLLSMEETKGKLRVTYLDKPSSECTEELEFDYQTLKLEDFRYAKAAKALAEVWFEDYQE